MFSSLFTKVIPPLVLQIKHSLADNPSPVYISFLLNSIPCSLQISSTTSIVTLFNTSFLGVNTIPSFVTKQIPKPGPSVINPSFDNIIALSTLCLFAYF